MKSLDIAGHLFGSLLALECVGSDGKNRQWRFRCVCGTEIVCDASRVKCGNTTSCGCYQRSNAAESNRARKTHGHTINSRPTPTYRAWVNMIHRCTKPRCRAYPNYGGRGITVCPEWLDSFEAFLRDMGARPAGRSLDRRENDGNYEKTNCRWATRKEQLNNQRRSRRLTHMGRTMTVAQWAEELQPSSLRPLPTGQKAISPGLLLRRNRPIRPLHT